MYLILTNTLYYKESLVFLIARNTFLHELLPATPVINVSNNLMSPFLAQTMAGVETKETWRSCANWLLPLEVIPKNHRVMTPDATFQDLAYTLRDGVILCHIASTIDESSINPRAINHRPQMAQFLCLQNIRHFLTACKVRT